jgi:TRAP-type C4-dicarboxylate transport system permease small subunit
LRRVDFANRLLSRLNRAFHRLAARPRLVAAWAAGGVLVCAWIAWTIHVGTTNGWTAALGVLITWPLVAAIACLLAVTVIGITRLARGQREPQMPAIAGAGPPPKLPKGHDSVTTLTFPS